MHQLIATLLLASSVMAQTVTVPMMLEGNAPIIELDLATPGGVRKARFLVDSGGNDALMLGSGLMAATGAKPTGPVTRGYCPLSPVPVKLAGMTLDLTGVRTLGSPARRGPTVRDDVEGLLPGRVLRNYQVIFDYPGRRFTLARPGTTEPRGIKIKTAIFPHSGNPRLELEIDGVTRGFLLDTGASFTMISRTVIDAWANANPSWPVATGAVGFANMFGGKIENEARMLRIADIRMGPLSLKNVAAVSRPEGIFERSMRGVMSGPIAGSLAGNVLRDFRVEIDYQNGFTYFERGGSEQDVDLVTVGLILEAGGDGKLLVSGISSAAAADVKAQVQRGDQLVAVDGVRVQGKALTAAARCLQGAAGARKQLSLVRAGKALTVSVTVQKIL